MADFEWQTREFEKRIQLDFTGNNTKSKLEKIKQVDEFTADVFNSSDNPELKAGVLHLRKHEVAHIVDTPRGIEGRVIGRITINKTQGTLEQIQAGVGRQEKDGKDPLNALEQIKVSTAPARRYGVKELMGDSNVGDRKNIVAGIKRLITFDW